MNEISMYDLAMFIWLDEMGCDGCHLKGSMVYNSCVPNISYTSR